MNMKPRFAKGTGKAPIYLSAIIRQSHGRGEFVFGQDEARVRFTSSRQFIEIFQMLIERSVALSVGGLCPGPADEASMLLASGELIGEHVEISWSSPEHWVVREMKHGALEWEEVLDHGCIVNNSFKADDFQSLRA